MKRCNLCGNRITFSKGAWHKRCLRKTKYSMDMIMLGIIYHSQQTGRPAGFTDIANAVKGFASRSRVSIADDRINDLGLVDTQWQKRDKFWFKVYIIEHTTESLAKPVAENIYNLKYVGE